VRTDLLHSGVAGGVFADLALRRFIRVDDTGLVRPTSATAGSALGGAAARVVEAVGQEGRAFSVRHWIEEIGPAVFELVSQQLVDAGVIRREQVGGIRRHETYPPVDLAAAATPRLELARMLRDPRRFTLVFGIVAVLVDVAGLGGTFSAVRSKSIVREIMVELADNLPGDVRAVTHGVRTAASRRTVLPR
jgi:hypothetical protein